MVMYIYSQTGPKYFADHNNSRQTPLKLFQIKVSLAGT
jgi:hypothetical protein